MRARRMSSGLTVGVGWRLADDLDAEQREVCKLLERDPARLGPAQLTTLRRHFAPGSRRLGRRARAAVPGTAGRRAGLPAVAGVRVHPAPTGRYGTEALTRARHSQLSGGEQSVSLHLPLFAAANALFGSARPDAPRLLGLDEAFAGVDDTGRGELMALAEQFDLDLFMTGYDLWATHPAVSGAAHYDLSHSAVDHAVSTVLLVWDGSMNIGRLRRHACPGRSDHRRPGGHRRCGVHRRRGRTGVRRRRARRVDLMTGSADDPGWRRLIAAARRSLERTGGGRRSVSLSAPTEANAWSSSASPAPTVRRARSAHRTHRRTRRAPARGVRDGTGRPRRHPGPAA